MAKANTMNGTDYDLIQQYKKQWADAQKAGDQKGMDLAHANAETVRAKYNYSGGADGSQYNRFSEPEIPEYTKTKLPDYKSAYGDQISDLTNKVMNPGEYSYDYTTDPRYLALEKQYTKLGQDAMKNTLGEVSGNTGGLASSFATSAASQANNNYMNQLSGFIPELEAEAYDRYQSEQAALMQQLSMLQGLDESAYGRYRDTVGDTYQDDNNRYNSLLNAYGLQVDADKTNYGRHLDGLNMGIDLHRYEDEQSWKNREWNHSIGRETIADQRYEDETAKADERYANETAKADADKTQKSAYNDAMGVLQCGGMPSAEELAAAGISQNLADLMHADFQNQLQSAQAKGSGGGSYGGSSGGSSSKNKETSQQGGIIDTMLGMGDDISAYEYLVGLGKTAGVTDNLWKMYQGMAEGKAQGGTESPSLIGEAQSVMGQLSNIPGLTQENRVAIAVDAFNHGRITEKDLRAIFAQLGV